MFTEELTHNEEILIRAACENYRADIRYACQEDQGTPDGKPGTVGHEIQNRLSGILDKIKIY